MRLSLVHKLLVTAIALGVAGILAGAGTYSALSSTTFNTGDKFAAGSVYVTDNDGGTSKLFDLKDIKPTTPTSSSCIAVTYNGSLDAGMTLYGSTSGTGLDKYLNLVVTRGSGTNAACSDFTADGTQYVGGKANGVVYDGTLQGFGDDFNSGLTDPKSGSAETWTTGETHTYKFQVSLQNDAGAQGLTATQTFTWEARNQ